MVTYIYTYIHNHKHNTGHFCAFGRCSSLLALLLYDIALVSNPVRGPDQTPDDQGSQLIAICAILAVSAKIFCTGLAPLRLRAAPLRLRA